MRCLKLYLIAASIAVSSCAQDVVEQKPIAVKEESEKIIFNSEIDRMNHHHAVNWSRFSGSNKTIAYNAYYEKDCNLLIDLYDGYNAAWQGYKRSTGQDPYDVMQWIEHALWANNCPQHLNSKHAKE